MTSSDADYLRWLENGDVTLGTGLRMEIAARFRELIRESESGQATVPSERQGDVSEPKSGAAGGEADGGKSTKNEGERP